MKAVVHDRFGPPEVLRIEDVPAPVPKDDEVLVRVRATTVNQTDCHVRRAEADCLAFHDRFLPPEVEDAGDGVRRRGGGSRVGSDRVRASVTACSG